MHKRLLLVGLVLALGLLAVTPTGWAAPSRQGQGIITYPSDGATVSGQVEVRGIATHPNLDFYQVRYAPGANVVADTQWQDFNIVEGQQVQDGVLGTWDTTQVPDGQYVLAVAVWGKDDPNNPYFSFVTNLTVNNADAAATPTPEEQEPTEVPPTPTVGPTPTPVTVEQPATSTPRPTPTPSTDLLSTPTVSASDELGMSLNVGQIRDGFCVGGLISVLLLTLWALYLLARSGLRWLLRQRSQSSSRARH